MQDQHDHVQRKTAGPNGYQAEKKVTRYELAATLAQVVSKMDRVALQPTKSALERKPGRPGSLMPSPAKIRPYKDVPANHWAKSGIAALQARGVNLVAGTTFTGEKACTGDEIAQWVEGVAAWVEGRKPQATRVRDLVRSGYIPQTHPLVAAAERPVTATVVADLLVSVLSRTQEKLTTMSPDSKHAL